MKHVVVDLEMNKIRQKSEARRICTQETIEIGAVMLDDNLQEVASFRQCISCTLIFTGCYRPEVSECYLFSVKLDFEKAKEYRKNYGAYLRHNRWNDIDIEVCMLI